MVVDTVSSKVIYIISSVPHGSDLSPVLLTQYARQEQIVIRKFLGAGDAAYRPRRGQWDFTAWVKSDIYDCLVL